MQSITDALKKNINAFVSQNYVIGKKYFMNLISGDQLNSKLMCFLTMLLIGVILLINNLFFSYIHWA